MRSLSVANLFFYKQWYDAGVKTRHPREGRKVLDVYRIQEEAHN